jgi:hypothetical protein
MEKLTFAEIISKFVRFPWEVCDGRENFMDREVTAALVSGCGVGEYFKVAPENKEFLSFLHAMAVPIIIASGCNKNESLQSRNRWKTLQEKERAFVLDELGLDMNNHHSMLALMVNDRAGERMASYIGAAFAFTTYLRPYVVQFHKLCDIIYDSISGSTIALEEIRKAGILIITGLGSGASLGADKIYGFLGPFLQRRSLAKGVNVLIDYAEGAVEKALISQTPIFRSAVEDMYSLIFKPALRMQRILTGENVYQYPLAIQERMRERRKAVII